MIIQIIEYLLFLSKKQCGYCAATLIGEYGKLRVMIFCGQGVTVLALSIGDYITDTVPIIPSSLPPPLADFLNRSVTTAWKFDQHM